MQLPHASDQLLCYGLPLASITSTRVDTPLPVWVRQRETPGMTDRVDCVTLLIETRGHTGDTPVVLASLLSGMVWRGL